HVAADPALPAVMLLPLVSDGPFATALSCVVGPRARVMFGRHRRAQLAPGARRARYVEIAIGPKKRKELRRQRHRLADAGTLTFDVVRDAAGIGEALGDFLDLEARGWKGRAGTAAASSERIRRFIESAVRDLAAEATARVPRLRVGQNAIAAIVTLASGATAWTWKIAYDEAFARASPGVQLMLDATEDLLTDGAIARVDSCATADHPM